MTSHACNPFRKSSRPCSGPATTKPPTAPLCTRERFSSNKERENIHFPFDPPQAPLDGGFRFRLFLLQEHGSDQFVDFAVVGEIGEFFLHGEVFLGLGLKTLEGGYEGLQVYGIV